MGLGGASFSSSLGRVPLVRTSLLEAWLEVHRGAALALVSIDGDPGGGTHVTQPRSVRRLRWGGGGCGTAATKQGPQPPKVRGLGR